MLAEWAPTGTKGPASGFYTGISQHPCRSMSLENSDVATGGPWLLRSCSDGEFQSPNESPSCIFVNGLGLWEQQATPTVINLHRTPDPVNLGLLCRPLVLSTDRAAKSPGFERAVLSFAKSLISPSCAQPAVGRQQQQQPRNRPTHSCREAASVLLWSGKPG